MQFKTIEEADKFAELNGWISKDMKIGGYKLWMIFDGVNTYFEYR